MEEEGGPHFIYYYEFSIYTQKKNTIYTIYIRRYAILYIYYLLFPDHMALPTTLELIWQFERETNKKSKTFFYGKKEKKL